MTDRLGIQRFDPNLSSQAKTFREDAEYTFFSSGLCFLHSIISIARVMTMMMQMTGTFKTGKS